MANFTLENVSKVKDGIELKGINMEFLSKNVYTLIYNSNEEMEIFMNIIMKSTLPDKGRILFDDTDIMDIEENFYRKNYINAITTKNSMIMNISVKHNIYLQMRSLGLCKSFKYNDEIVRNYLKVVDLEEETIEKDYEDISEEELAKLRILRGIIKTSGVIIIKDIVNKIDDIEGMYSRLKEYAEENDNSIIIMWGNADMSERMDANKYVDKLSVMSRGRIINIR